MEVRQQSENVFKIEYFLLDVLPGGVSELVQTSSSLSKRPGRRSAGSRAWGRLVAPSTSSCPELPSWETKDNGKKLFCNVPASVVFVSRTGGGWLGLTVTLLNVIEPRLFGSHTAPRAATKGQKQQMSDRSWYNPRNRSRVRCAGWEVNWELHANCCFESSASTHQQVQS